MSAALDIKSHHQNTGPTPIRLTPFFFVALPFEMIRQDAIARIAPSRYAGSAKRLTYAFSHEDDFCVLHWATQPSFMLKPPCRTKPPRRPAIFSSRVVIRDGMVVDSLQIRRANHPIRASRVLNGTRARIFCSAASLEWRFLFWRSPPIVLFLEWTMETLRDLSKELRATLPNIILPVPDRRFGRDVFLASFVFSRQKNRSAWRWASFLALACSARPTEQLWFLRDHCVGSDRTSDRFLCRHECCDSV